MNLSTKVMNKWTKEREREREVNKSWNQTPWVINCPFERIKNILILSFFTINPIIFLIHQLLGSCFAHLAFFLLCLSSPKWEWFPDIFLHKFLQSIWQQEGGCFSSRIRRRGGERMTQKSKSVMQRPNVHQVMHCEGTPNTEVCISEGHWFSVSPSCRTTSEKVRHFTRLNLGPAGKHQRLFESKWWVRGDIRLYHMGRSKPSNELPFGLQNAT